VSNWTDVAGHRSNYYAIEQHSKEAAHDKRKVELRQQLAHQMAHERHLQTAREQMVKEEARQVAQNLADYHTELAAADKKNKAKSAAQRRDRELQLKEQAARAAAAERLHKLEDDELSEHLRKEQQADRDRAEAKQRANEAYHRQTAIANEAAKARREEQKQAEWAREQQLNAEWKAMLDKQEAERTAQYARLRERIQKMQRAYEDNAGAENERREREENERRERYIREEEARVEAEHTAKRAAKQQAMAHTTKYLFAQMAEREETAKQRAHEGRVYAASVREEVKGEERKEAERKTLVKAKAKSQMAYLNEQVVLQKELAANDPGASEMTALEASINRPLLVSIVQHKYPNPNVLN